MKIIAKLISVLVVVYCIWLFHTFVQDRAIQPILETQVAHYIDAAQLASTIANENEPLIRDRAINDLLILNNGPMQVIGDERVNWALSLFETCIREPANEKCKDRDINTLNALLTKTMKASLAQKARFSIGNAN